MTKRRAALIARDQKPQDVEGVSSGALQRIGNPRTDRAALWVGKEPRPSHGANNGRRYNIETGWFYPEGKFIQPGARYCRLESWK
jgi:hypothetical protein